MKFAPLVRFASLGLLVLAGCPGDDGGGNATTLWLAPDNAETNVKLVEDEPHPY